MLDIAYIVEANIAAAEILKVRAWNKILGCDLTKPFGEAFINCMDLARCNDVFIYWSIMYGTHGA